MVVSGPFLAGGISRNNQTSVTMTPTQNIPQGALIWIVGGSNVPDTANITITDTSGNDPNWVLQSFVAPPGLNTPILVAVCRNAIAIPTTGSITINSDTRGNWDTNLYFHTGARGEIFSTDIEVFTTAGTNPVATIQGQAGMTLFGTVAVVGPSSDGFTNDPNWGTDQVGNIARTNVTIHASGRLANVNGSFGYAPTLGTARRSLIFAAAFF